MAQVSRYLDVRIKQPGNSSLHAAMFDTDYTSISSDEVFPSGSTDGTMCVNITILDDTALEGNQSFTLTLTTSDPDVVLGNNVTIITITDNDG